MGMTTFNDLWGKHLWKPIKNCPGRYVLEGGPRKITLNDLVGQNIQILEFKIANARDTVLVVEISDGGIISYRKPDGSFIHTLCNIEGFKRKLEQLEIEMPSRTQG